MTFKLSGLMALGLRVRGVMMFACFKTAANATLASVERTTAVASNILDVTRCVYSPYVARRNMLGAGGEDTKVCAAEFQCGAQAQSYAD